MSSSVRDAHVLASSTRATSVDTLLADRFDVILAASSWDRRSVVIADATAARADLAVLMLFSERDARGLREDHDRVLDAYLHAACDSTARVEGDSRNVSEMWERVCEPVYELFLAKSRPLRLLVDLSCVPRYYSLGILGTMFRTGIVSDVAYLYAEGRYPEESKEADRHEMFTLGNWQAVPVPGFEGNWDPEKTWMYLVSVGFEGSKTLRLVSRFEPNRVEVVFPDPPVQEGYAERTKDRNAVLFERYGIADDRIIRAHAADPVAAWQKISESGPERPDKENCAFVCCGTKPHSLALALRALTRRDCAVHYIVPDRHLAADVQAAGVYWRYDVRDVTALRPPEAG